MSSVAPTALEQRVNLVQMQDGIPIYLWIRSISFLTVREQAVSVRGMSRFFRQCSQVYMQKFWSEPKLCLPQDASSLARAMEICQYLMEQEGYVEGTTMVVELGSGVHKVVGSCDVPGVWGTFRYQKTLSIPFDNLSFVGKGERETIVHGSFVVENGRKISFTSLTVKNPSGLGLGAYGAGTEMVLQNVTVENCQNSGVWAQEGAKIVATECQSRQNGGCGGSCSANDATGVHYIFTVKSSAALPTSNIASLSGPRILIEFPADYTTAMVPSTVTWDVTANGAKLAFRLIGQGAYGKVYQGFSMEDGSLIAVKQILTTMDDEVRKRRRRRRRR